jgi:glycosyltransferase involved in cell wall biosynthesis
MSRASAPASFRGHGRRDALPLMQSQRENDLPEHPDRPANGAGVPRILHVIHSLDRGGIETWLLHVLRHIDRRRSPMDALVLNHRPSMMEAELGSLGCRVFGCPGHRRPWVLRRRMMNILKEHGPYDIVHSHIHHFDGAIVRVAADCGIPVRIAHSRNDTRVVERDVGPLRRTYTRWMKRWIRDFATHKIAISVSAAEDLFGPDWKAAGCTIIHSGRDLSPFTQCEPGDGVRQSLGLPEDAVVLGHVGHFHWRKNHGLVVDVAEAVFRREPRARLLLVGGGKGEGGIRARVAAMGIADRVVFAGPRDDVLRLMQNAMDVFLFPSHYEGLGVAAVEAQAAGLPCVIGAHLPSEIDIVPELVQRLPLTVPAEQWASAVLGARRAPDPKAALEAVLNTDFNIERSVDKLAQVYEAARAELRPLRDGSCAGPDHAACTQPS